MKKVTPLRSQVNCPNCGQRSNRDAYPFCSRRCADVDLNAWLGGHYRVTATASDEDGGSAPPVNSEK